MPLTTATQIFNFFFFEVVSSDCYLPSMRRNLVSSKQRVNSLLPLVLSLAGERVSEHLLGEERMGKCLWESRPSC